MFYECSKQNVMPGEPQLGMITECELHADEYEVAELVADAILSCGYVPSVVTGYDDYTDEPIDIDVSEWFDEDQVSVLNEWAERLFECDEFIFEEYHEDVVAFLADDKSLPEINCVDTEE